MRHQDRLPVPVDRRQALVPRRSERRRTSARRRVWAVIVALLLIAAGIFAVPLVQSTLATWRGEASPDTPATTAARTAPAATQPDAAAAPGPNLIANSGFETGLQDWRALPGTILGSITPGHDSPVTARLQVELVGSTAAGRKAARDPGIAITAIPRTGRAGEAVTAAAWFKSTRPPATVALRLSELAAGQRVDSHVVRTKLAGTGWQRLELTYETARSGTSIELELSAQGLSPDRIVLVDEAEVRTAGTS
jgi:hypothetical protein